MENILITIKLFLGIKADYYNFDEPILGHINSTLTILNQIGLGPKGGFIADLNSKWSDLFKRENPIQQELIKTYIKSRVQLMFDPPSIGSVLEALKEQIKEYEWRLNVLVDPVLEEDIIHLE